MDPKRRYPSGRAAGAAKLFVLAICAAAAFSAPATGAERLLAYIGTDAPDPARAGAGGGDSHGEGIYVVTMDPASGKLSPPKLAAKTVSPTWLTIDQNRKVLYAIGAAGFNGTRNGAISAFAIDPASGALTLIDTVDSQGITPCYGAIDPSGKFLVVANYGNLTSGGSIVTLPILANGGLGDVAGTAHSAGPLNPARAADDPPGNFAVSDHRISHMHMVAADPSGHFILADDAGLDQILVWKLDTATGALSPNATPSFLSTPGSAPRHLAFSPDGRRLYQLHEQDSILAS